MHMSDSEELNPLRYLKEMREKNAHVEAETDIGSATMDSLYVYQYYFNEVSPNFKTREKTLHLAFKLFVDF